MDVPMCPSDSSHFLFLQAETAAFALLLFQQGSWSPIPFSVAEGRKGFGSIARITGLGRQLVKGGETAQILYR